MNCNERELLEELKQIKEQNLELTAQLGLLQFTVDRYKEILDSLLEVVFEIDTEGRLIFCNQRAYEFFGFSESDNAPDYVLDYLLPEDKVRAQQNMAHLFQGREASINEYTALKKDGSPFPVMIHSTPIMDNGEPIGVRGIIMDVTERKQMEERLKFLSLHDALTGLYNRAYFEQEIERLNDAGYQPVGIVICDVDGLKLINDIMGHNNGDLLIRMAAEVIQLSFDGIIARIGGDEFAVIIPNTTRQHMLTQSRKLQSAVKKYNRIHPELLLNISVGYALSEQEGNIGELIKQADNNMYRQKLTHHQGTDNYMIKILLKLLHQRQIVIESHVGRLGNLVTRLAHQAGLPQNKIEQLLLFARFHDVGKIRISDAILLKPGKLNGEEWLEMKRHSEIGHRIALSVPDLVPIADWVLKRHENWDGSGYPLGLRFQAIPLECRIMAIADAYEVMTSNRPYRTALNHEAALEELQRCAGTQFDPQLAALFLSM